MRKLSPYHDLKWRVDCKPWGQHFYQTIAAFNHEDIALDYARDCAKRNKSYQYMVMVRQGNGWVVLAQLARKAKAPAKDNLATTLKQYGEKL